jgi:hypothetical protein
VEEEEEGRGTEVAGVGSAPPEPGLPGVLAFSKKVVKLCCCTGGLVEGPGVAAGEVGETPRGVVVVVGVVGRSWKGDRRGVSKAESGGNKVENLTMASSGGSANREAIVEEVWAGSESWAKRKEVFDVRSAAESEDDWPDWARCAVSFLEAARHSDAAVFRAFTALRPWVAASASCWRWRERCSASKSMARAASEAEVADSSAMAEEERQE